MLQWLKKENFRPKTGPEFPKNDKNNNKILSDQAMSYRSFVQNSDHDTVVQKRFAPYQ